MGTKPRPWRRKSDGLWVAQVSVGPRGSRHIIRRYSSDRDEATRLLEAMLDDVAVATDRTTVGAYLRSWLEMTGARTLKPSTLQTYEIAVRRQLVPHVGAIELAKLAPDHVERMIAALESEGLGPKGIRNALSVLGRVLEVALRRGLVRRNVARLVDPPRARKPKAAEAMTAEEGRRILAAVTGDRLEALYVVTLACGLRQAEVLGLRWVDVDLDAATLRVAGSLDRVDRQYVLTTTKTDVVKTLALPAFAVEALRDHRRRQLEERAAAGVPTEEGLVFVSRAGRPINGGWLSHRWRKILAAEHAGRLAEWEQAGSRAERPQPIDRPFHGLRHGHTDLLIGAGVHPKVIQARDRHSSITQTMDRYGHVADASDVIAAASLQEAIG